MPPSAALGLGEPPAPPNLSHCVSVRLHAITCVCLLCLLRSLLLRPLEGLLHVLPHLSRVAHFCWSCSFEGMVLVLLVVADGDGGSSSVSVVG
jgi:hypothetical protein